MGRLVQQTSPSRADREHSSRRGRGRLLCPACDDPQRRVGLKQNGLRETRCGSDPSPLVFGAVYAAAEIKPLWRLMHEELLRSTKLFVDETTAPVLDPGRGRTK